MTILYLKWVDSGYSIRSDIWQTQDEVKDLLNELKVCDTVGFLIEETDDWVVLAQTTNMDLIRGGYIIYKANILERNELN